jgi:septal ring factor EnvC (AmiA/AmiB activator)
MPSNTTFTATLAAVLTFATVAPTFADGNLPNKPRAQYTCSEVQDELDILYNRNAKLKVDVKHLRYQHRAISGNIKEMATEEAKLKAVAKSDASKATKKVARAEQRKLAKKIRKFKQGNRDVWADLGEAEDFLKDFPKRKADLLKLKKACKDS